MSGILSHNKSSQYYIYAKHAKSQDNRKFLIIISQLGYKKRVRYAGRNIVSKSFVLKSSEISKSFMPKCTRISQSSVF